MEAVFHVKLHVKYYESLNMELNMERVLTWITWNALNMELHVKHFSMPSSAFSCFYRINAFRT